jgi:hypothetical protein
MSGIDRRTFIKSAAATQLRRRRSRSIGADDARFDAKKMIGIQIGAVSFIDEGVDKVLDIVQEKGTSTRFFPRDVHLRPRHRGRQVPGQPLPDHGVQAYDEKQFHGGNYATPHEKFYEKTVLKQTRAPDHGDAGHPRAGAAQGDAARNQDLLLVRGSVAG